MKVPRDLVEQPEKKDLDTSVKQEMARVLFRAGEVRDNVEADSINVEKYVKEIATLMTVWPRPRGECLKRST